MTSNQAKTPIDLDAMERANSAHQVDFMDVLALIGELRAARKVVEAALGFQRLLDDIGEAALRNGTVPSPSDVEATTRLGVRLNEPITAYLDKLFAALRELESNS